VHPELLSYFTAEKHGAVILMCIGALSVGGAYTLWETKSAFIAMVWPLLILGAFEFVVGAAIVWRTPAQVAYLDAGIAKDKVATIADESTRMRRVNKNFEIVKVVEAALIILGLLFIFVLPPGGVWHSVGLGIVLHGGTLLVFDAFAHHRAEVYVGWLQSL
jgi:hypothetical protein